MATTGKSITCRAAITWEAGQPAKIETVEVAPPKVQEVRVKMVAAGICYSDVSLGSGRYPHMAFPTILGHEGVGVVESLGPGVSSLEPGDTVIPLWAPVCGDCRSCKTGRRNICGAVETMMAGLLLDRTTRTSCKGRGVSQTAGLGLFSEYIVIPEIAAAKVAPCPNLEKITPFGCCMPTGYGAAVNTAMVSEGSTVAIWGLGAIGLCTALGCRDAKAARIIGVDVNSDKFQIGKDFGCTEFIKPEENGPPVSVILKEITGNVGVDYAFVCVGNTDVMEDAVEALSTGPSECIIVGIGPHNAKITVNHYDLVCGKSLKGSHCGDCICKEDIPKMLDKYYRGTLPTDQLISQVLQLHQINEGFELLKNGKTIRTVIKLDG